MLTPQRLRSATSDEQLFKLLGIELQLPLPAGRTPTDAFVRKVWELPIGMRAMACTYDLDVSLTMDDLGWHFGNWHHRGFAEETSAGLRELGLSKLAQVFDEGLQIALEHWEELGQPNWSRQYHGSELERRVKPLADRALALSQLPEDASSFSRSCIFNAWVTYARKHPERCCTM